MGKFTVPISVGIPTYGRGLRVVQTVRKILACDPGPKEVLIHIDEPNGQLEAELRAICPSITVLVSSKRIGPGGGRHRCIQLSSQPIFASFDDDSWPVDDDFFANVMTVFARSPDAGALASVIYTRGDVCPVRTDQTEAVADYVGCGYAVRKEAYNATWGHIDRACAYGIEEVDISMQLHALGWKILQCGRLRVFHDTQMLHHATASTVAGTIENVALRAFLRYPVTLWPYGAMQVGSAVFDAVRRGRFRGLTTGLGSIPLTLAKHRGYRHPLPADKIRSYLQARHALPK